MRTTVRIDGKHPVSGQDRHVSRQNGTNQRPCDQIAQPVIGEIEALLLPKLLLGQQAGIMSEELLTRDLSVKREPEIDAGPLERDHRLGISLVDS